MVDSGVNHVVSIPGPGRLFRGAELTVNGEPLEIRGKWLTLTILIRCSISAAYLSL